MISYQKVHDGPFLRYLTLKNTVTLKYRLAVTRCANLCMIGTSLKSAHLGLSVCRCQYVSTAPEKNYVRRCVAVGQGHQNL